jgi:hypothetical protein
MEKGLVCHLLTPRKQVVTCEKMGFGKDYSYDRCGKENTKN